MSAVDALVQSMQFNWQRHEILSNNLANVSTTGFKRDDLALVPDTVARATTTAGVFALPSGGAMLQWTDFSQGFVQGTGRSLDAAINGPGFFVVETPAGPRYTRSGVFNVRADGVLVGTGGMPVLGRVGTITLTSSNVTIAAGGEIVENGRVVDTLRVVDFPKPYRFLKEGEGIYAAIDPLVEPVEAQGFEITGAAIESANVNTVQTMVTMIDVLRTYESSLRALQSLEEANKHATSEIGKVS
jgi:flagellar basal-body rod protein FlgG